MADQTIKNTFESLENMTKKAGSGFKKVASDVAKDAVESLTGTGDYDMTGTHEQNQKILPKGQKQQIQQSDAQKLAQMRQNLKTIDQQIVEAHKKRQEQAKQAIQATQAKKTEYKQEQAKKQDKFAAIKAMIKANQGSKEGSIRASG